MLIFLRKYDINKLIERLNQSLKKEYAYNCELIVNQLSSDNLEIISKLLTSCSDIKKLIISSYKGYDPPNHNFDTLQ